MNEFGGEWTNNKNKIIERFSLKYIENQSTEKKLMYFDGFAGSGLIKINDKYIKGASYRVLSIDTGSQNFDRFIFVDKDKNNVKNLEHIIDKKFTIHKDKIELIEDDCNEILIDHVNKKTFENYNTLMFLDPFGSQIKWNSLELLKGNNIDVWLLIPIGISINRQVKKEYTEEVNNLSNVASFFGLSEKELKKQFFNKTRIKSLIDDSSTQIYDKISNFNEVALNMYLDQMKKIYDYSSSGHSILNTKKSYMYDFRFFSNDKSLTKLADEIVLNVLNPNPLF